MNALSIFHVCSETDGRGDVKLLKYHIRESPKGYHVDKDRFCFLSISNLVQHYQRNPIVPATGTKLTIPLRDASPASPGTCFLFSKDFPGLTKS